ncbi:hypothetical protein CTAYLR_010198 [Chrysophaeum taylorii]|uniref:SSD domain-containing protein n=1 Tax=Chrysophaeum taylorii TaxID=2483200 RepID=A0AAD7XLC7_9STRA|nr:hypothetical protein CTAYLR_010198 [Chrysophaeum taylorii]
MEDDEEVSSTAFSQVIRAPHKASDAAVVFKMATTFRTVSFCVLFCINLFWLLFTVALALGGLDPINDDHIGEVGLFVPDDPYQQRANAYEVAKDEADMALTVAKCAREDAADPITLIVMKGRFERDSRGNALTKSGLETLRAREQRILSENGWKDRCAAVYLETYPTCEVDYGTQYPTGYGNATFAAASEDGCQLPFSPVWFFEKYADPNFEDIPGTIERIQTNEVDWLAFVDMMHKDFTASNLRSKIMVSQIYAGTPRHPVEDYVGGHMLERIQAGFSITYYNNKDEEREREHLNHWIEKKLGKWLDNRFTDTPIRTLYSYADYDPIDDSVTTGSVEKKSNARFGMPDAVTEDLALLVVSLVFVILYMWLYTGSLFITACGIFQILMSFFGANLLYRYCWPHKDGLGYNFFTLFCALALFIIMGIGADDIFVYWDTWQGSSTHAYKTVAHRMSHVFSHAAVAMAVTSSTTVLAFVSNLSSPFIGIRTFGVFSALLVIVNYCAVVTFFPVAVLVYEKKFKDRRYWWDPCWQCVKSRVKRLRCCLRTNKMSEDDLEDFQSGQVVADPVPPVPAASRGASTETTGTKATLPENTDYEDPLPIWFRETYAPFIFRRSRLIIGSLVAFWAVFLAFACFLTVRPFEVYELLPSTENFHQYTFVTEKWRSKSSAALYVHVLYGLEHRTPVNLHGVKTQNFVEGESGTPNWDTSFDMDTIAAQLQLYNVAEEFENNPRKGLKINKEYGINTQLAGSSTGSLEDTPDGGASSSLQTAYGIQSFAHALAQWENVSELVDATKGMYQKRDAVESSCTPCFPTFNLDPIPSTLGPGFTDADGDVIDDLVQNGTSNLIDDCRCFGYFPIPTTVCVHETRASTTETILKCQSGDENVAGQIGEYLGAGSTSVDESWWTDFIFALTDSDGNYDRMALYDIQVQTTLSSYETDFKLGLRMSKKWDDWMDDQNRDDTKPLKVMAYVENSEGFIITSLLAPSGVTNMILSLFLAWLVLVFSTGNIITSSLATITIGMICTIVLGFIHIVGWGLGPLESILIVIVVGFSVDYTVHLADSFMNSRSMTRKAKLRDALVHTGSSVLSGAISTLGASIPMFGAKIIFFQKFGAFVFMTIGLSLLYSLGFFCALLFHIGPLGKSGALSNYYGGCVESMHKHMIELEQEQAVIDSEKHLMDTIHEEEDSKNVAIRHASDDDPDTGGTFKV